MVTTTKAKFTRADYMLLPEGLRAELLDGILVKEPAPTAWHQALVARIHLLLADLLREESGGVDRIVMSPIDVFIDDHNILQPDVLVLSETSSVRPGDKEVAIPILVVEVLSPSTARRDREQKTGIYLTAGVREVWLVDPAAETVEIRTAAGARDFKAGEKPRSTVVTGFSLDLVQLFGA